NKGSEEGGEGKTEFFQELAVDSKNSVLSKSRNKNLQSSKNLFFTKFSHNSEIPIKHSRRKQPFYRTPQDMLIKRKPKYQVLRKKRIKVSAIPGYPFQGLKK